VGAARNLLRPFAEHFGRTIELSRRATALDPTLAIPHVHFGVKAMYLDGEWEAAGTAFRRAVEVEPTYAEGHRFLAIWLALQGESSAAIDHFRAAVRHEPDMPIYRNGLADALMAARQHDDAIAELRHALARDPTYWAARTRLLRCLERQGRFEEAVAERLADARADGAAFRQAWQEGGKDGYLRARAAEVRLVLERTAAQVTQSPGENAADLFNPPELSLALLHAELGDWDAARAWEERACARQPWRRRWFTSHPDLVRPG
jgi:tetratricopeptide (TPR) repeat protein